MIGKMLQALGVTMRNVGRPKVTEQYPFEKRPRPTRYRATFALVHDEHGEEACIGCQMCENICPSTVINVTAGGKKESPKTGKKRGYCDDFTLNLQACIFCELCVQVCPTDAIVMCSTQEVPGYTREDLVLTMDKLYGNEKLRKPSEGKGSLFVEWHGQSYGLPKPEGAAADAPAKPAKVAKAPKPAADAAPAAAAPAAPAAAPVLSTSPAPAAAAPADPPAAAASPPPPAAPAGAKEGT